MMSIDMAVSICIPSLPRGACPFHSVPVKRRLTEKVPPQSDPDGHRHGARAYFSIIKPDATRRNLTGAVNDRIEKAGLRIVAQKRLKMTKQQAESFYAVHRERPFFAGLVAFMTSGPVVVQVLEGRERRRKISRSDGRNRSGEGRGRHHPQGLSPSRSKPIPSTVPTAPRTRRRKSLFSSGSTRSSARARPAEQRHGGASTSRSSGSRFSRSSG